MIHNPNRSTQIGNICVQWSSLEYMLAQSIWAMVNVEAEVGKILTASLDIKSRAKMAFAIAHEINAPISFKKEIKIVITELQNELIHRRNQAVHGIHFSIGREDAVGVEMHRGKGGRGQRTQLDSELSDLGNKINLVTTQFANALIKYRLETVSDLEKRKEFQERLADILKNNSLANEGGDTKGP